MKRKRAAPKAYKAYIDESSKGEFTFAVAMLVEPHAAERLNHRWQLLRQDLRRHMVSKGYPRAQNKLADPGFLPEIHAVELYRSTGYFNYEGSPDAEYWKHHRKVLGEAVRLIAQARPVFLIGTANTEKVRQRTDLLPSTHLAPQLKYKKMRERMDRLFRSPYVAALNILIGNLEYLTITEQVEIEVFCDDNADGRGFSVLQSFEAARAINPDLRISAPSFHDSSSVNLLQAADVVAYVLSKTYAQYEELGYLKPVDISYWKETLDQYYRFPRLVDQAGIQERMTARLIELLITQSGGPKEYQVMLRESIRPLLTHILNGLTSATIELRDTGLFLSGDQIYRPPSEDGDLSENSVPAPLNGSQAKGDNSGTQEAEST